MSQAKKPAAKAAPSRKGAAARAEKTDETKTVEFRGLTLKLPTTIPGTLLWDFNDLLSGDERSFSGFVGLLGSLVGHEQNRMVRAKVEQDGLSIDETFEALEQLLSDIFDTQGLSLGE